MRRYRLREVFATIQGEGRLVGTPAIFVRFAGCNLWDGREEGRARGHGACARWCDTDFRPVLDADAISLADLVGRLRVKHDLLVLTGGEPLLQVDGELLVGLRALGNVKIAVETNGTIASPVLAGLDHVTVSPKRGQRLAVWRADELRVVVPGVDPDDPANVAWDVDDLLGLAAGGEWGDLFLSPQDDPRPAVRLMARDYALTLLRRLGPPWRLSVQVHKLLGLP